MSNRSEAIRHIKQGLTQTRYMSDSHSKSISYGQALGLITMAEIAHLISYQEFRRLSFLAGNATLHANQHYKPRGSLHAA